MKFGGGIAHCRGGFARPEAVSREIGLLCGYGQVSLLSALFSPSAGNVVRVRNEEYNSLDFQPWLKNVPDAY